MNALERRLDRIEQHVQAQRADLTADEVFAVTHTFCPDEPVAEQRRRFKLFHRFYTLEDLVSLAGRMLKGGEPPALRERSVRAAVDCGSCEASHELEGEAGTSGALDIAGASLRCCRARR